MPNPPPGPSSPALFTIIGYGSPGFRELFPALLGDGIGDWTQDTKPNLPGSEGEEGKAEGETGLAHILQNHSLSENSHHQPFKSDCTDRI